MNEHTVIHTFRHTCASRIVKETGNLYQCQRWLGHSDPKMTMRYAKYAPKDMAELARLLEQRQERTALDERQRAA
jgi:integrase